MYTSISLHYIFGLNKISFIAREAKYNPELILDYVYLETEATEYHKLRFD